MIWGVIEIIGVAGISPGGTMFKSWREENAFRIEETQKSLVTKQ